MMQFLSKRTMSTTAAAPARHSPFLSSLISRLITPPSTYTQLNSGLYGVGLGESMSRQSKLLQLFHGRDVGIDTHHCYGDITVTQGNDPIYPDVDTVYNIYQ